MTDLVIQTPKVFQPFLVPSRYKAAFGGRGSGKSHFFAELSVERCLMAEGFRLLCVREVQKSLKESAMRLIIDKINALEVGEHFRVLNDRIETPGGGMIIFQGMQDHSSESVKSFEGFDAAWIEEAQTISARSFELLRPTIRKEGSEIWASWNPRNAKDPIDVFFRGEHPPKNSVISEVNYYDNPFFPAELEEERQHDERTNRDRYGHIWLGHYEPQVTGAIWDRESIRSNRRAEAPALKRIVVAVDPAVSSEDGSDHHGVIVAGVGEDDRGYVLEDGSLKGTPLDWARRVVALYDKWEADAVVAEVNQGGEMVAHTLRSVRPGLPVTDVRASRGKHIRAEPIASLYHLGKVSHVGTFDQLEDEMCKFTAAGYEGDGSPDRTDALVWAMTTLFPTLTRKKPTVSRPIVTRSEFAWMG